MIVVGSGIGGGVVADQLSDAGRSVLVLEAGSYLFPTHIANLPRQQTPGRFSKHVWGLWDELRVRNTVNAGGVYNGAAGINFGGRCGPEWTNTTAVWEHTRSCSTRALHSVRLEPQGWARPDSSCTGSHLFNFEALLTV